MTPDPKKVEAGRRGGKASGEARRKRRNRSFLDVLRSRVDERPEELVDRLLSTGADGVAAVRVLEASGAFERLQEPEPVPSLENRIGPELVRDLVRLVGPELVLGVELCESCTARVRAPAESSAGPIALGTPPPPERADRLTTTDGELEPGAVGTEERRSPGASEYRVPLEAPSYVRGPYKEMQANVIYRQRLALGLPTGNRRDVYRA